MSNLTVIRSMFPEQPDDGRSLRGYERVTLGYPVCMDLDTLQIDVLTPEGNMTTFAVLVEGYPYETTEKGYLQKYSVEICPLG